MITHEKNSYDTPVTEVVEVATLAGIMDPTTGEGGQWGDDD